MNIDSASKSVGKPLVPFAFFLALAAALFVVSRVSYPLFHTIVELIGVAVGISVFFLTYHARKDMENNALLMLGVAFLFIGALSLLHALAYKGVGVFQGYDSNLPTQLWIGLRLMTAASFLFAPLTLGKPLRLEWLVAVYAPATALVAWLAFSGQGPDCYVEGRGLTPFKIAMEYLAIFLLLGAGQLFWSRRAHFDPRILRLLLAAIGTSALAGLAYSIYVDVYGLANFAGHIIVLASVVLLRQAVFVIGVANPYALLSRRLRLSEEKFRGMVERSADGLFQADLDGVVLTANPAFARLLGCESPEAALGLNLADLLPGGAGQFRELVAPALSGGVVRDAELQLQGDGRPRWISFSAWREAQAEPPRLEGSLRDIGERKEMERLRQDIERIMQHELRSPLTGMVGIGELLKEHQDLPADAREMAFMIEETGRRLLRLIDENAILRKLEAGVYAPHVEVVDLWRLLQHLRLGVESLAHSRDVGLRFVSGCADLGRETCPAACVDPMLLEHLLANLLKNAVEAAPAGSTVTLDVSGGEVLRLTLHNLGAVPLDMRGRFFERYATSGKVKGTGLGTYVARLAALAHGGEISYETSEERGTTLFVVLPNAG